MSTLLKMQKFHPLCSRCIGMYPLQNRWTVLRYLQCYENFSECCTHLILPETALFSPTPTFAKEPKKTAVFSNASGERAQDSGKDGGIISRSMHCMIPAVSSRCTASGSHSDAVFPVLAIKIRDISICLSPPRNPVFYCCSLLYNISFDLSTSKFLTFDKIRQNPTRFSKFSDAMHSLGKRCIKLCAVLPLF